MWFTPSPRILWSLNVNRLLITALNQFKVCLSSDTSSSRPRIPRMFGQRVFWWRYHQWRRNRQEHRQLPSNHPTFHPTANSIPDPSVLLIAPWCPETTIRMPKRWYFNSSSLLSSFSWISFLSWSHSRSKSWDERNRNQATRRRDDVNP